jgi:hypothetical protein
VLPFRRKAMKFRKYAYIAGAVVVAAGFSIAGGRSLADGSSNKTQTPAFAVDPSWPQPLPAPVGNDGKAHTWVQGEVAGTASTSMTTSILSTEGGKSV